MGSESVSAEAVQSQVEGRGAPVAVEDAPARLREWIVYVTSIKCYVAVCGVTAWDAVKRVGCKDGSSAQVMKVAGNTRLHGHYNSGKCRLEFYRDTSPRGANLADHWSDSHMLGWEAEVFTARDA